MFMWYTLSDIYNLLWDNKRNWLLVLFSSASIFDRFTYKFIVQGIKDGCPCIVEIRGTQGCALVGDLQGRSQGTTLSVSDLHHARATILNLFYNMEYEII